MENVLVDLKWRMSLVYLDDCVVFSEDFPTHLVHIRQVLQRFRKAGFKLKMKKCHWGRDQVAFLGHIVTPTGILPNPEKVKAVMNVQKPHDLHTLRAFLGLTRYFRRYIQGFAAAIAAPLERLKQKDVAFHWDGDYDTAFLQLQRKLVKPSILVYPDFTKRFKLYVDSSHLAVGACLMQEVDGRDRAVAYASMMLTGSQRNWVDKTRGTTEIECWGIVWATRKFRCYLDHNEFDLYTDHQTLTWIFRENARTTNAKLVRCLWNYLNYLPQTRNVDGTCGRAIATKSATYGQRHSYRGAANANHISRTTDEENVENNDAPTVDEPEGSTSDEVGEPSVPIDDIPDDSKTPGRCDEVEERTEPLTQEEQEDDEDGRLVMSNPSQLDLFGLDTVKFIKEQNRTHWMRALKAFLMDGALSLDSQLLRKNVLMRKVYLRSRGGHARSLVVPVIPLPFIETVLHYCHADVFSAHLGKTKTADKKDVIEYVRECVICGSGKGHRPWRSGLMQRMPVHELSGPFSLLVVDAIGPLVTTPRGNKYILAFVDYFTRWVEAYAVKSLETITFVDTIIEGVISRHDVPERLLSDRGFNFMSNLAKSLYETRGD
ncbi:Retrotransposon Polyprotein [Phytophthora megakarya]|uniref:Retrotransposon Polyprotein n=1 Tax=Phytophthora megakarya TaxID=4795 RepID=A0A225UZV0_9STRA|nr:Retrotransposon Polyprotein [Phytophthora megakarya]